MDWMTIVERGMVVGHVTAGVTALIVAPIAMAVQKGGRHHRRWGKVYFWSMFVIFLTALGLVVFRPNFFLFAISILSFYGAFSGTRGLYRKRMARSWRHAWLDWLGAGIALAAAASFIGWGVAVLTGALAARVPPAFAVLGLVFGVLLGSDALQDVRSLRSPPADRNWWWTYHMQRILGSFLAAVTAFAVQNLGPRVPASFLWLVWVGPGLIGGFGIAVWVAHYRRKFSRIPARRRPRRAREVSRDLASRPG